jgi:hypothetical protein
VQLERPVTSLPPKRLRAFLAACVLAALCLSDAAAAQSGRRNTKKSPAPPPAAAAGAQADTPAGRITSVVIGGHDISKELKEDYSTSVSTVVKAFTAGMTERARPPLMGVVNGGKMKREEAVERAKRETGAYVLWFGYSLKMVGLFDDTVEHIDYVVLMPQTAEVLVEGRVYPDRQKTTVDPGGILRLPTQRRRQRTPDTFRQLEAGGREIAARVRNKL